MMGVYTISNCACLVCEVDDQAINEERIRVTLEIEDRIYPSKRYKLYTTTRGYYFNYKGHRVYLDEVLRID